MENLLLIEGAPTTPSACQRCAGPACCWLAHLPAVTVRISSRLASVHGL